MSGQHAFYDALRDPDAPMPPDLFTWNGSSPRARFDVYRNNVMVSLIDALADTFPVTQQLVGEPFFRAMSALYITHHPPRSPILADYGATLPRFIADFPPAASVPYLADIATLEVLLVRAYHAADCVLSSHDHLVAALSDTTLLSDLRVGLHPSLGLLNSPYAIVSIWAAHQDTGSLADINPYQTEHALIIRPALEVNVLSIDNGTALFLAQLQQGASLGQALTQVQQHISDFDLITTLSLLIHSHTLVSLHP
ncbi:DNA-binding domain-containing protein [Pectobacteriaceae bacterium C52]|nr:DNA-binding domain-containing protein [Pectobacteriaceae bacterium C52]